MKHSVAIRHLAFEDLGNLVPVLHQARLAPRHLGPWGAELSDIDPAVPNLAAVLGGPVAVYEAVAYPWLVGHALELAQAGIDVPALRAETARHGVALGRPATQASRLWLAGVGLAPAG